MFRVFLVLRVVRVAKAQTTIQQDWPCDDDAVRPRVPPLASLLGTLYQRGLVFDIYDWRLCYRMRPFFSCPSLSESDRLV
jgi:hypothetical protein